MLPAVAAKAANAAEDAAGVASSRMSYSRFLEYLDMGRVKKVRPTTAMWTAMQGLCLLGYSCLLIYNGLLVYS